MNSQLPEIETIKENLDKTYKKLRDGAFSRFGTVPARDGRTDIGQ